MIPNPLVTVAIPTYNRPRFLKEAVASALAQTYRNLEVIIGDNAASEGVAIWSDAVAREDSRLQYQNYGRNLGMAGNWNALARAAAGDFFILLADDDRLLPNFVATLLEAARRFDAQLAFSNHFVIDDTGTRLEEESYRFTRQYHRDSLQVGTIPDPAVSVWRGSVPITACLLQTAKVQQLQFREDLNTPEIEFFARLANEDVRFAFVPEYLSEYRLHSGSGTAAGLWNERLAEYLLDIPVSPSVEPFKRSYMEPLLDNAVNRCLERGERARALKFLASEYYPPAAWRNPRSTFQKVCACLPPRSGRMLLRAARFVYQRALARSQ